MIFQFEPIGFLKGGGTYPQEAPHQSTYAVNEGVIELLPGKNFEQALEDLNGFDRIWVLFVFDRNDNWKPKVRPPVGGLQRRIGVFATRSPHRPNPIGMSAVELVKIEGRKIHIRNFDLLDGTPVLDIKPYIPEADAFPDAGAGWRDEVALEEVKISFSENAQQAAEFISAHGGPDLENAAGVQLSTRELDPKRQRLSRKADGQWELAFRTWRLLFEHNAGTIVVKEIYSGYTAEQLSDGIDPYGDKDLHRKFLEFYRPESSCN
ncbi:MAG: tRNA (N6-threonylcarbamoyladenosine(37)-N6)-methyltransferase TrmO [Lentisphaeria bacterium]|nr:tRNA (N6-threonylcarbamoyladenosine(37)-N6)-methyltransferase TrmO [Lentisphaeria bacterium]